MARPRSAKVCFAPLADTHGAGTGAQKMTPDAVARAAITSATDVAAHMVCFLTHRPPPRGASSSTTRNFHTAPGSSALPCPNRVSSNVIKATAPHVDYFSTRLSLADLPRFYTFNKAERY
jgi:hypothetical protein